MTDFAIEQSEDSRELFKSIFLELYIFLKDGTDDSFLFLFEKLWNLGHLCF